jgi:large subunit ribosomal protein L30
MEKIAVVRIRGRYNLKKEFEDTLTLLGLKTKNSCAVIEVTPNNMGMVKKVKDFVTYGEVSDDIVKKLSEKKAPFKQTEKKIVFTLPNPKKGFKSVRLGFKQGGDLGYRGDEINAYLERVIENI